MAEIKTLVFDLDDTLYSSKDIYALGLKIAFEKSEELGMGLTFESFQDLYKQARKEVKAMGVVGGASHSRLLYFKRMTEIHYSFTNPCVSLELDEAYNSAYAKIDFTESIELLKELKEKYQMVILTNHICHTQLLKLMQLDAEGNLFDRLYSSEELGAEKPELSCYENLLKQLGRNADECMMIGDSREADVQGAINVGMPYLWLNPEMKNSDENTIKKLADLREKL
ncbi:MAG: HAD family hydrolase [Bdellovibrionota bacterium]|nr:HAD family hydrolase [Bdellovibrionota bacterium]